MRTHEYIYKIGEIVNDSLIIVSKTRNKHNQKAYVVQSIKYPEAPTYIVTEHNLNKGQGDSYVSKNNMKIFEGNSLYSIEWIKPYIVDIEEAKITSPGSNKYIIFKCPECNKRKKIQPNTLVSRGFFCNLCSVHTSYPELFFLGYSIHFELEFEHQVTLKGLPGRRFDFMNYQNNTIVECMGEQHYNKNNTWYQDAIKQDVEKRNYCKNNNIRLIELDCRYSDFNYIKKKINNCEFLPSIEEYDEKSILEIIEQSKLYPVKDIIELYRSGKTAVEIGEKHNVHYLTIISILKKSNISIRSASEYNKGRESPQRKKVKCTTTGEVYESGLKASKLTGVSSGSISRVCRGESKTAGKHPSTGERLRWEYI